jgi:hypothetical protein
MGSNITYTSLEIAFFSTLEWYCLSAWIQITGSPFLSNSVTRDKLLIFSEFHIFIYKVESITYLPRVVIIITFIYSATSY